MISVKKNLLLSFIFISILFTSCESTSGLGNPNSTDIDEYYRVLKESYEIPEECKLGLDEEPKIYYSDNVDSDLYSLRSWYYYPIGYASLNGPVSTVNKLESNAKKLCKRYGAKVALYSYEYTDTRSGWTQYGSYNIKRYDCSIWLFVPYEKSYIQMPKMGIEWRDLNTSDRLSAQRNTGAYISLVYEKSAAFYANLAKGDIIIEINGIEIIDSSSIHVATLGLTSGSPVTIKYLRYGRENTASFNIY